MNPLDVPRLTAETFASPLQPLISFDPGQYALMRMDGFTVWQVVLLCAAVTGTMATDETGALRQIVAHFVLGATPRYLHENGETFQLTVDHLTEGARMLIDMLHDQYPYATVRIVKIFEATDPVKVGPRGASVN